MSGHDRAKGESSGVTLAMATPAAGCPAKDRQTAGERSDARREKTAKQQLKAAAKAARTAENDEAKRGVASASASHGQPLHECPKCSTECLTAAGLGNHLASKRDCMAPRRAAQEQPKTIKQQLTEQDIAADTAEATELEELATVKVAFHSMLPGISFAANGGGGEAGGSCWPAIASIAAGGEAARSLELDQGFVVLRIGDTPVTAAIGEEQWRPVAI